MANKPEKKLPFGVKCAPLKSDRACYRRSGEILRLKYLKPDGQSRKTKEKLEESCPQVVFAILIPAKLTQIWRTSCLRIVWRILRMHDKKLNGCRQRILFARYLIPRKCSLCSQGMNNWALRRNWKQWLSDAKFRELNKMHYGQCENDEFELLTMTANCFDFIRLHAVSFILWRHFPARSR